MLTHISYCWKNNRLKFNSKNMKEEKSSYIQREEETANEINKYLNRINNWATQLQYLVAIATTINIVSSIAIGFLVGTKIYLPGLTDPIDSDGLIKFLAFTTAFFSTSIPGLKLEKKARDFREAYRYLKPKVYLYVLGEINIQNLVDAYVVAEKIIGHIEVEPGIFDKIVEAQKQGSHLTLPKNETPENKDSV
jgi:hypothetical protein